MVAPTGVANLGNVRTSRRGRTANTPTAFLALGVSAGTKTMMSTDILCGCGRQTLHCELHGPWCLQCKRSIVCPQCDDEQDHRNVVSEQATTDEVAEEMGV